VSVERYRTLAEAARARLQTLGFDNVEVIAGDGLGGAAGSFDRILVTAAAEEVPQVLLDALAEGGVMVLPLGPPSGVQHLVKLARTARGLARETLIPVHFVALQPGNAHAL